MSKCCLRKKAPKEKNYAPAFFGAYFIYYSAYALFASYLVSYLSQRGFSAVTCGLITSLTLVANVVMQPISGYLTDTFLSVRDYLILSCIGLIVLCICNMVFGGQELVCFVLIVFSAGFAYPFGQLMDAWVNIVSHFPGTNLVYSRVRAFGSIGYALAATAVGAYFSIFGYGNYFLLQAIVFAGLIFFLQELPKLQPDNRAEGKSGDEGAALGFFESFRVSMKNPRYRACLLIFSLYWLSHRPVGSYLALFCGERGGTDQMFGWICGIGAVTEFVVLLWIARSRDLITLKQETTMTFFINLGRPALFLLPGIIPLFLGQIVQSVSFGLFYTISVECFSRAADPHIRSFSISVGLTVVTVIGTVTANLLGGFLFDKFGSIGNTVMSLGVSCIALLCFLKYKKVLFDTEKEGETER